METKEQLQTLRERVSVTMSSFRDAIGSVVSCEYEDVGAKIAVHDNVKVIEAGAVPFDFEFDQEKQQVVVVLRGRWEMRHQQYVRKLEISDVVKIPMGSPSGTIMHTDEVGAKFVYVQFR